MRLIHCLSLTALLAFGQILNASVGSGIIQVTFPISPRGTGDEFDIGQMHVPVVVSGDMPKDILRALALPITLPTLISSYHHKDANIISICGIGLDGTFVQGHYLIDMDLTRFMTKTIGLEADQILEATIESVRITLRECVWNEQPAKIEFRIKGSPEQVVQFKHLERTITLEPRKPKETTK
jgi:hypothetical protein